MQTYRSLVQLKEYRNSVNERKQKDRRTYTMIGGLWFRVKHLGRSTANALAAYQSDQLCRSSSALTSLVLDVGGLGDALWYALKTPKTLMKNCCFVP